MRKHRGRLSTVLAAVLATGMALADERRSLHELMSGFGADLDNIEVTAESLTPGLHVLRGAGDAAVFFRDDNVVHVGDLFSTRYPYIDAPNGGTLAGLIAACRALAGEIDDATRIVSGHAPVVSRPEFMSYLAMLETSFDNLNDLVSRGMTLEQVMSAKPTAEFDAERGNPTLFITMAYRTLAR